MPTHFTQLTPEALLGRNDSKNPTTTCRGITSSGRPCRRALASPKALPNTRRGSSLSTPEQVYVVDLYCWQHKDQVQQPENGLPTVPSKIQMANRRRSTELFPLEERNSIDTFVQRLGLNDVPEERRRRTNRSEDVPIRNSGLARRTQTRGTTSQRSKPDKTRPREEKYSTAKKQSRGFWASLCCMAGDDDDYMEVVRHRKRVEQTTRPPVAHIPAPAQPADRKFARVPAARPASSPQTLPIRPLIQPRSSSQSQTENLLALIPPNLSPQTTSLLLAELIKPISPNDEAGYIYIFWLTPQNRPSPPETTARSLLAPPPSLGAPRSSRPSQHRRVSDVMSEYSSTGAEKESAHPRRTIMLKIGRANNVARRMSEWQRQCGYALNLVRWYPYVPSSSSTPSASPSPRASPPMAAGNRVEYPDLTRPPPQQQQRRRESEGSIRKVGCVKRVERLIHLELAEQQVKRQCETCGREHREWFEVEASREGVQAVDACVRRWVAWAEARE